MIQIEGYLTQKKLETALQSVVGNAWRGREISVPGSRRRWDMAYSIGTRTVVIEYDGDAHYCNSLKITIDREKDQRACDLQFEVVRFPYWVQLTTETLSHYFDLTEEVRQEFPHGFITTKVFPASFCPLGLERFLRELNDLPHRVQKAVVRSLRDRAKEHGSEYVIPEPMRPIIEQHGGQISSEGAPSAPPNESSP
jgi:hypothetical protein